MVNLKNFFLGTSTTFFLSICNDTTINLNNYEIEIFIKNLISLVGGIVSALIIAYLKNKFPNIFNNKNKI